MKQPPFRSIPLWVSAAAPHPPLSGKCAVITGGSRGIGRAAALALAKEGARVVVMARTASDLNKVVHEIENTGGHATAVVVDMADPEKIKYAFEETIETFGTIDVLVNNAGSNKLSVFAETDPIAWWSDVTLNLRGPYLCTRYAVPGMMQKGWGRVINIGSTLTKRGVDYASAYSAAKSGLLGLTRSLSAELAPAGITVNMINPGFAMTELGLGVLEWRAEKSGTPVAELEKIYRTRVPMKRLLDPADVVSSILFLASPASSYVTGTIIDVSGGLVTG